MHSEQCQRSMKFSQLCSTKLPQLPSPIQSPFVGASRPLIVGFPELTAFEIHFQKQVGWRTWLCVASLPTQCTIGEDIWSLAHSTHWNVFSGLKFPLIDGAVRLLDLFQIPDFNWWISLFPDDYVLHWTYFGILWVFLLHGLKYFSITIQIIPSIALNQCTWASNPVLHVPDKVKIANSCTFKDFESLLLFYLLYLCCWIAEVLHSMKEGTLESIHRKLSS